MQPSAIRLVLPGNVHHNSGGNAYNAALVRALDALGVPATTRTADGDWPVGGPADRSALGNLLAEPAGPGTVTLVDGLVACGAPEQLEAAARAGTPVWILLHMPLDGYADLEGRAVAAAAGVICSSSSAAAELRARHGLDGADTTVAVALPGTDPAGTAVGSTPPHLAMVAALLPNKSQLLFLRALAALTDLDWSAALVGADTADPEYAALLRAETERLGLGGRVRIPGELRGDALDAEWARTDLTLLISRAETFGMAVTESLARGIPAIIRRGTGALEALTAGTPQAGTPQAGPGAARATGEEAEGDDAGLPGAAVALAEDPAPLTELLRRWLTEPELRARWRATALDARQHLPGWDATARTVLEILGR
ncbi:glycosyltransferase [Arthrobacter sp. YD4]|uniref:glycosyltransferase n=1 Tax=Arthrobacter sp. YD4 TaxID=3058043 RepID=UPI0025B4572A|nr:glycosyltransferase [Arthrobacter sp. YD4]MDN3935596.1 glycosyltransferase [Arthrobacter sp. YD4]